MQRRQIINQLKEEGIKLSVTKFKGYLQHLGYPMSGDYDFDDDQVHEIKATVRGDQQDRVQAQTTAQTVDVGQVHERAEGAITTALQGRVGTITAGLQRFDATLAKFEEQAATAVVQRLSTSEARIMALVEDKLNGQNGAQSETGLNLDLLVDEATGAAQLGFPDPAGFLAEAVAHASI